MKSRIHRLIVTLLAVLLVAPFSAQAQPASDGGAQLAFVVSRVEYGSDYERDVVEVWLYDVASNSHEVLVEGDVLGPLAWTPDGQQLVFQEFTGFRRLDLETGDLHDLTAEYPERQLYDVLADGRVVVQDRDSGSYQFMDPLSGAILHSYPFTLKSFWSPSWSPDGAYMSFASTNGYTVIETETGAEFRRFPGQSNGVWAPDGRYLYLDAPDGDMILYAPASDETISIPFMPLLWAPDGASFIGRQPDNWLVRYDIADERAEPFVQLDDQYVDGLWSSEPDTLAVVSYVDVAKNLKHLQIFDSAGRIRQTFDFDDTVILVSGLAWRPRASQP